MAWTEWKRTDALTDYECYQWQRRDGDLFEMYQIVPYPDYVDDEGYYVGGGLFRIKDFDRAEVEHALETYCGLDEADEEMMAEALFQNCFADWDLDATDTYEEAQAWINKRVLGA